jgi:hypothetical protein
MGANLGWNLVNWLEEMAGEEVGFNFGSDAVVCGWSSSFWYWSGLEFAGAGIGGFLQLTGLANFKLDSL